MQNETWHCNGSCNDDIDHEVLIIDEDFTKKTKCTKCGRETWR